MRFIPTKIHGVLDYLSAALFIASPWLFDFANGGAAQWVPVVVGVFLLLYSLGTDYELGLIKQLAMPTHLTLDWVVAGLFLAASPWLFGFADEVYLPHLVFGMFSVVAGLCTHKILYDARVHRQV